MTPLAARRWRGVGTAALLIVVGLGAPGCYTTQMALLKSGLDSLRTEVAAMDARDEVTARTLEDTRRDLAEQRDLLLSTKATTSSSARETDETLARLEGKLDDIMARFRIVTERAAKPADTPPATTPGTTPPNATPGTLSKGPNETYDQAVADLTQGRYGLALTGYRDFMARFPDSPLGDNAQYGAGECFFAQAQFDSALVEYQRVDARFPKGDRAPASLYKVGLCQERLGRTMDARRTFDDLIQRFPQSGEAQLARERIGAKR